MQYHTEEEQDVVELGTVSLHSTFCRLLRQSVQLSAMGASRHRLSPCFTKISQICHLGARGRESERASERWSAILHFFAQSDFFARSICRFLCISGFTLPFPSLSLCLSSNVCSAGWGAKRVWLQLSLIQDGRMTLPFALLTVG